MFTTFLCVKKSATSVRDWTRQKPRHVLKVFLSIFYHSNLSQKILDPVWFLGHANCLYFRDNFGTVFSRDKLWSIQFLSKLTASQNRGLKLSAKIDLMSRFLCYDFQHQLTLIKTLWPSSVFLVTKSSFKLKESRRFYLRFFTRKNHQFGVVTSWAYRNDTFSGNGGSVRQSFTGSSSVNMTGSFENDI